MCLRVKIHTYMCLVLAASPPNSLMSSAAHVTKGTNGLAIFSQLEELLRTCNKIRAPDTRHPRAKTALVFQLCDWPRSSSPKKFCQVKYQLGAHTLCHSGLPFGST